MSAPSLNTAPPGREKGNTVLAACECTVLPGCDVLDACECLPSSPYASSPAPLLIVPARLAHAPLPVPTRLRTHYALQLPRPSARFARKARVSAFPQCFCMRGAYARCGPSV